MKSKLSLLVFCWVALSDHISGELYSVVSFRRMSRSMLSGKCMYENTVATTAHGALIGTSVYMCSPSLPVRVCLIVCVHIVQLREVLQLYRYRGHAVMR